jgi:cytochrome d ubiquinol oxidase subunit I
MIGFGALTALISAWVLFKMRRGKELVGKWLLRALIILPFLPIAANSFGWIFTEGARQPWIVFGLFKTSQAVSPTVSASNVLFTMITFTLLYGALAVIEFRLMLRTIKVGSEQFGESSNSDNPDKHLTMAY